MGVLTRAISDVEVSILLLVTFPGCRYLAAGVWTVVQDHGSLVGNSSLRMGSGSSECEEELARRPLMVSREPDSRLDATPN